MSNPFMFLMWTFLPMVIVSLLTKKFAECYLREAKPIIIGTVSSIVALMILGATIGGFAVGLHLFDPENAISGLSWLVALVVFPIIAGFWIGDFIDGRLNERTSRSIFGVVVICCVALFTFSVVAGTGYKFVKNYYVLVSSLQE